MAVNESIETGASPGALDHIPGGSGVPFFGETIEFVRDPFGFHERRIARHGPVYKINVFGGWTVVMNGPDALEMVLMDRERNFSSYQGWRVLHQLFPGGLMLRDFDDHRLHRRIMQAAFKPAAMVDYVDRMNGGIDRTLDGWPVDRQMRFYDAIKDLTLELGAAVFLGLEIGEQAKRVNQAFIDEVAASIAIVRTPWPGNRTWRGIRARAFLLDLFRSLIPERRAGDGNDMFSQLCRAKSEDGEDFTDQEIIDHLNFLLMAAHDTTTSGLTTMIWALAENPDWQDALRAEAEAIDANALGYDMLDRMPMTERVFKEALRLRPPVPFIPRYAVRPFSFGGYDVPGDTPVSVGPGLVMRDPGLWSEPASFDPDRFSPNRAEDQRHRFAWSPFGGGAHKCIGLHFAMMQVKAFTFQFVRRYRVRLADGQEIRWRAIPIPKPANGLPVFLERV